MSEPNLNQRQTMISFAEARKMVLDAVNPVGEERKTLATAPGFTLSRAYVSRDPVPPFDNSAMDGYAVRLSDFSDEIPCILPKSGEIRAGQWPTQSIPRGTCMAIMTGAPLPPGTEAVVPVEWTTISSDNNIVFHRIPGLNANLRRAGDDLQPGIPLLDEGALVTPAAVGVLAGQGYSVVDVYRKPTVAVLSTGDELVDVADTPGPGQIRNSNGLVLTAQAEAAGAVILGTYWAPDSRAAIRAALEKALKADVLVVSGGVSVGEYDFVKEELEAIGFAPSFWKVKQRPGKPLTFGIVSGKAVFGLPGNPVSSSVCFEQYVRPALLKMAGRKEYIADLLPGTLTENVIKKAGLHYFSRGFATYDPNLGYQVKIGSKQGSHVFSSLLRANCLVHLPEERAEMERGQRVYFEWLPWLM